MTFFELSFLSRSLFAFWALLLCAESIAGIVMSAAVKRYRYTLLSLLAFVPAYFLWQVTFNIYRFGTSGEAVCLKLGAYPWPYWIAALVLLSALASLPMLLNNRRIKTAVTPLTIKLCADEIDCGICYWRDNGHVIFANDCINDICTALTGKALMNGNNFSDAVSGGILPVGDRVWSFACRELSFDGGPLHEMIASDVTEIHRKNEALRRDNENLRLVNEELRAYSQKIDDTVRRKEILQAKVNIHDEMNRLMLSTVAVNEENEEDLKRIFTLWEKNALLLCLEADERKDKNALERIDELASALGLKLEWLSELPKELEGKQCELFFAAAREAITNAVKHSAAKRMEISFEETENEICCCFENDGAVPLDKVRFTGGLANLELLAQEQKALVSVDTEKSFRLTLRFPK